MFNLKFFLPALLLISLAVFHFQCSKPDPKTSTASASIPAPGKFEPPVLTQEFSNYWYQGKAEISTYAVEQERYGQIREAEQVNVFVTEDFSARKQVKLDDPQMAGEDRIPVLKLNSIRRFKTGIYDYSLMQSVFTPIETQKWRTLKTTTTVQDWCGQVFVQFNVAADGYRVNQYSYFEMEGDSEFELKPGMLEDEILNLIRLSPEELAEKETTVVPNVIYSRFRHKPIQAQKAKISIEKGQTESILRLAYEGLPRKMEVKFETAFPHKILAWEETENGKLMSRGTLKKTIMDDYWKHNDNGSAGLRNEIDLKF